MTDIATMRNRDARAREAVVAAMNDRDQARSDVLIQLISAGQPDLSVDTIRRAVWTLVNDQNLSLTPDYILRKER